MFGISLIGAPLVALAMIGLGILTIICGIGGFIHGLLDRGKPHNDIRPTRQL